MPRVVPRVVPSLLGTVGKVGVPRVVDSSRLGTTLGVYSAQWVK